MNEHDSSFKVLLIGEYSVKKGLIQYLFPETINSASSITVGIEFYSKIINNNGQGIKIMIWNPIAADRFYIRLSQFLKGANCAIIACDDIDSEFLHELAEWNQIIRKNAGDIPIILITFEKGSDNSQNEQKEDKIPSAKDYITDHIEILASEREEGEYIIQKIVKIILNHNTDT